MTGSAGAAGSDGIRVPVAVDAPDVRALAQDCPADQLDARVTACRACPRLVQWRAQVAATPRRAFEGQRYWARPVPGFGADDARVLIVGLAPAAHGANRTGRMFTGDRSGDWLFRGLHRAGLASQPTSISADDGLRLIDTYLTAPVHCAPPDNKPTTVERDTCRPWLERELQLRWPRVRVVVALGAFGWASFWRAARSLHVPDAPRAPRFGHGVALDLDGRAVLGCYHVSQQNTFTGRLTESMLDAVLQRAADAARTGPVIGAATVQTPVEPTRGTMTAGPP